MTAVRDFADLMHGRRFRRLFTVRAAGQLGDGLLQVALASYVIFSPERQPTPAALAAALAVVLLPFSLLGPFAGVFLDRWSRRQTLLLANVARACLMVVLATVFAGAADGPVVLGLMLLALSVNRFILAGLSASLPHVVRRDQLVVANAVAPTGGTFAFVAGLAIGSALRAVLAGRGINPDVAVVSAAGLLYLSGGLLALRLSRSLLGPDFDPARPAVRAAVRHVVVGMVDGLRHVAHRRPAALGLAVIGAHRFWYGLWFVAVILLFRNDLHADDLDAAFTHLATAILVNGAGYLSAAVVTPVVTQWLSLRAWVVTLLVLAGVTQGFPGGLYTEPGVVVAAYFLGLAAQGVKICVDTLVQRNVDDAFRGRVFAVYDVVFNAVFVAAAATAAVVLPMEGRSYPVLALVVCGYLLTAVAYAVATEPERDAGAVPA